MHPGSTTEDFRDYVKLVVRTKTDFLVTHTGMNDLMNGVNTMKEKKNIVKYVRDLDKDRKINIGILNIISSSDRNPGQQIRDLNLRLKRYSEGNNFLFVDNVNVEEFCLNNSKLCLNHKGTNLLCPHIKNPICHY